MHNTKVSLDLASDEVTRIAVRSAFLELATGAAGDAGEAEVVSKPAPQTPPPTHAGGQDDGSYTNSLKYGVFIQGKGRRKTKKHEHHNKSDFIFKF